MSNRTKEVFILVGALTLTVSGMHWLWGRLIGDAIFPPTPIAIILFLAGIWGLFASTWNLLDGHTLRKVAAFALPLLVMAGYGFTKSGLEIIHSPEVEDVEIAKEVAEQIRREKQATSQDNEAAIEAAIEAALESATEE